MNPKNLPNGLHWLLQIAAQWGRKLVASWGALATLVLLSTGAAQAAALSVSMMPSFDQNPTYANAALNESIQVWGRVFGGTGSYTTYTLDFGDGTPVATGTVSDPKFIKVDHTYTTGGTKTATLTVTDSANTVVSRSAKIRVLLAPTHSERVNMAIEKGLVYLYLNQFANGAAQSYWFASGANEIGYASTGAALLSFEENGHLPGNDFVADVYAETVSKGLVYIAGQASSQSIGVQAGGNPDINGNGLGAHFTGQHVYAHSYFTLALINAFPSIAAAQAVTIPAGVGAYAGKSYYTLAQDAMDTLYWAQSENGIPGGWFYYVTQANSSNADGSTHQWPNIVALTAKERWGQTIPAWVVSGSQTAWDLLQTYTSGVNDAAYGGCGYNPGGWRNLAKTGGLLVGHTLGGRKPGVDPRTDAALKFIGKYWINNGDWSADLAGWTGTWYAMYGLKKGLQVAEVTTVSTPYGNRDWYQDLSAWLLGNATLLDSQSPNPATQKISTGFRNQNYMFGQRTDGSWASSVIPGAVAWSGSYSLDTASGVLILTRAVTKPLPVAVITTPIADQSARNPSPFSIDGSGSYHLDPNSTISEYLWILDPPANPDWTHPTASGPNPTVNPGWNAVGTHTIMLRVGDNQNPVNYATTTATVNVTLADVAPVAVPMPPSRVPQIYTGNIGDTIVLDGSASFDVDGDAIATYAWDLNGDGLYATAADIALDTSGGLAVGSTASVVFTSTHSGQIGLKVGSYPHDGNGNIVGPIKFGTSSKPVDIYASPNDLYVASLTVANLNPTVSGDVTAVIASQAGSAALNNVVVRFYNGNPLSGGAQLGANYTVNVPAGGGVSLTVPGLAFGGSQTLWVFADANNAVAEYDETNNTKSANVANQPPTAGFAGVGNVQCNDALTISVSVNDPDRDPLTVTWTVDNVVFATHSVAGGAASDSITKVFGFGSHTVKASVTDGKSAAVVTTTSFTIADTIAPTIATLPNVSQTADPLACSAVVTFGLPDASDNCGVVSVVNNPPSGSVFPVGTTTVTSTATDAAGLVASSTFTVTVTDDEKPVISTNADIAVNTDAGSPGAVVTYLAPTATDNCPGVVVSCVPASGSLFPIGQSTVVCTATDAAGNTSTSTFKVTVTDLEAPVLSVTPGINANIDAGTCGAVVTFDLPTASDNSGSVTVVAVPPSGSTFPVGNTTVTLTATDASGNVSTSTFVVTIKDNEAPKIGLNTDISVNNEAGKCSAVVTFLPPTVSDNCPGVSVVCSPASGSVFPVGTTLVTCTATDAAGLTASSTFNVTVVDAEKPTIGKNADIVVNNDAGRCGAVVNYGLPTAADNCAIATVVNNPPTGSTFPVGVTTVTSTATDTAGNSISSTFTVTVKDNEKPTIGRNGDIVVGTDLGQCGAVVTYGLPAATDNCGVSSVVNVPPSGSVFPVGVTTVTSIATDAAGNSISSSFTVTVKDTEAPKIATNANVVQGTDPGQCGAVVSFVLPSATDNCGVVSVVNVPPSGSVFPVGVTTVKSTATDAAGNTSSSSFTVTVNDVEAPKVTCSPDITIEFANENGAVVNYTAPVVTDNCPGVTYTISQASGTVFPIGVTTVTTTATDKAGNKTTCSFVVRVLGANGTKLNVLAEMKAANVKWPSKSKKDDDDEDARGVLSEAISELTDSLNRYNWVDQTHLTCKRGDNAIQEERETVNQLVQLLRKKGNPIAPALIQNWINRIVACDRLLAVVAIADAITAKADLKKIAKAQAEVAAGDADIAGTKTEKYNSGINHYENAWNFATALTCKESSKGYEDRDECKGGSDDKRDSDGHRLNEKH